MIPTPRQYVGCWLHERWQTELVLLFPELARRFGLRWIDLCNRNEHLAKGDNGARICIWQDSSLLTVARFFPSVGGRLLRHCIKEWPFNLNRSVTSSEHDKFLKISVIIPVGGKDRLETFKIVLASLLCQNINGIEIIVVEHSLKPVYNAILPKNVKYIFVAMETIETGYNKNLAMNVAVSHSSAPYVLLHDADIVVPSMYLKEIISILNNGWEAVRPLRFLFYLDMDESKKFIRSNGLYLPDKVQSVMQNFPGASTAMAKSVYDYIGGHDESFEGWGGADLEFLDRLKTVRLFQGAYIPGIHLWHTSAPKKMSGDRNKELMIHKRKISPKERIKLLQHKSLAFVQNIS